ncbi:hypothetical protein LDK25_08110 [Fusobacterium nucleatum]|uniref:hypothetical protein n=1 Tax=Fusobacterium nucleatum TaxID=851 RepID=UPI0030EF467C
MEEKEEILIELRKKIKKQISDLELKLIVIQGNLIDTKNSLTKLQAFFIQIDENIENNI